MLHYHCGNTDSAFPFLCVKHRCGFLFLSHFTKVPGEVTLNREQQGLMQCRYHWLLSFVVHTVQCVPM